MSFNAPLQSLSGSARMQFVVLEETLVLSTSGLDTDSVTDLLPANSLTLAVVAEVTTTISGGGVTLWRVGAPGTASRFLGNQTTLTAGFRAIGMEQMSGAVSTAAAGPTQGAAGPLRVNTDAIPSQGAVRLTTYSISFL
jgi:cytochrome c biogenesis protein CcdA